MFHLVKNEDFTELFAVEATLEEVATRTLEGVANFPLARRDREGRWSPHGVVGFKRAEVIKAAVDMGGMWAGPLLVDTFPLGSWKAVMRSDSDRIAW